MPVLSRSMLCGICDIALGPRFDRATNAVLNASESSAKKAFGGLEPVRVELEQCCIVKSALLRSGSADGGCEYSPLS